ncbi:hypothetical protein Pta02_19820 [Planobispora takensis]|uniref:Uncharacterized protein n=1 Tax=Planobispora takensis TaxID=1367882 RepID=A0A8J3T2P3_9ACTN|nr:hypothetical protein Pta02_19820 [Planobispora takensis]
MFPETFAGSPDAVAGAAFPPLPPQAEARTAAVASARPVSTPLRISFSHPSTAPDGAVAHRSRLLRCFSCGEQWHGFFSGKRDEVLAIRNRYKEFSSFGRSYLLLPAET